MENSCGGTARVGRLSRGGGATPSTLLLILAEDRVFPATSLVGNTAFDEHVVSGAEVEALGPTIEDIVVHAEGASFSANFSYDVVLQYSFRNGPWSTQSLLALQSAGSYVISSPFVDRSKLGMRIRFVIRTQVTAGSTATQKGTLNVAVAIRLRCCK